MAIGTAGYTGFRELRGMHIFMAVLAGGWRRMEIDAR
jgi:hypothetical protein